MSRKLIFGIAVLTLLCIMLAAPMHEAMERCHVPFPMDGDFGAMTLTMMVGVCAGMAAVAVTLVALMFGLVFLLRALVQLQDAHWRQSLGYQKLLYSPPRSQLLLRI